MNMYEPMASGMVFTSEATAHGIDDSEPPTGVPDFSIVVERICRRANTNPEPIKRSIWVARHAVKDLCENAREENILFLRFSARTTDIKAAGETFSDFLEKVLRRRLRIIDYVYFKHRHADGRVHFHVLVSCSEPVRRPRSGLVQWRHRSFETLRREWPHFTPEFEKPEWDGTPLLESAVEQIKKVLRTSRFALQEGFDYQPINSKEDGAALGDYCTHYMEEAMRTGRSYKDKGARLWSASKSLRDRLPFKRQFTLLTNLDGTENQNKKLSRYRIAMFALEMGCKDLEELHGLLGSRWFYKYREWIYSRPLAVYFTEDQFSREWGTDFTPEQLGVVIWNSMYSRQFRKYRYTYEFCVPPSELWERVLFKRNSVLGLYKGHGDLLRRKTRRCGD